MTGGDHTSTAAWAGGERVLYVAVAAGLATVITAVLLFVALLRAVSVPTALTDGDLPALMFLAAHRTPAGVVVFRTITDLGSPGAMAALAVGVCGWLAWRRRADGHRAMAKPFVVGVVGVGGIGVIDIAVKNSVARPRPPQMLRAVGAHGFSFPSGHTLYSTLIPLLCAGMIAVWVLTRWLLRVLLLTASFAVAVAVGCSRMYLGVHYPSDVLASWSLGTGWAALIMTCAAVYGLHTVRARGATG